MSEILEPIIDEQPAERLSWIMVWISVLTRPSIATFERILRDPQASPRRAYLWLFFSVAIGGIISVVIRWMFVGIFTMIGFSEWLGNAQSPFISLILQMVISAVSILWLSFYVWVMQWIAVRFFGGSGTFAKLIYAITAYLAPVYLISSLFSGIPLVSCLAIPLTIYGFVLGVMAVKAVNKIGWGGAVVTYFAPPVLVFGLVAVITICVLVTLGPSIGNVFQNVILESGGALP